jgi:hypothetical protein
MPNNFEDVPFTQMDDDEFDRKTGEVLTGEVVHTAAIQRVEAQPSGLARGSAAAIAMAAREQSLVRARIELARSNPRSLQQVRAALLRECDRPGFARAAIYKKPQGNKTVEGLSIRFAEAAIRIMGNASVNSAVVEEDGASQLTHVAVTDLETNSSWDDEIRIAKTVERSSGEGREVIAVRKNKQGKETFIVRATEDEMFNRRSQVLSKARRQLILAVVPSDIQDECKARCYAVQNLANAQDPRRALRDLSDAFGALGVEPKDLSAYVGRPIDSGLSPAELTDLRQIYQAVKDGDARWSDIVKGPKLKAAETTGGTPSVTTGGQNISPSGEAQTPQSQPTVPATVHDDSQAVQPPWIALVADMKAFTAKPDSTAAGMREFLKRGQALDKAGQDKFRGEYNAAFKFLKERDAKAPEPGSAG